MIGRLPGRLVLLGHPVSHSLSRVFQNAALRRAGIPLTYELLDVEPSALAETLRMLREARAAGNVTIPHKSAVYTACDVLTPVAARVGAVNTFWVDGRGALTGDNTDVDGVDALADVIGVRRQACVVACLGSGGAAAALCAAVERWPGTIVRLAGRSPARTRALAERFGDRVQLAESAGAAARGASLVVNATPIGMCDSALPLAIAALPRDADVMDLVYRAGETLWVREARAAGHRAADGCEMLLRQGAVAFERWFQQAPDVHVMRQALQRAAVG